MKTLKKLALALMFCITLTTTRASTVTVDLGSSYTSGSVDPISLIQPWVSARLDQVTPMSFRVAITAPNLTDPEFLREIDFSLGAGIDPSTWTVVFEPLNSLGTFTHSIHKGVDSINAGGGQKMDFGLEFGTSNADRFNPGEKASFLVTMLSSWPVEDLFEATDKPPFPISVAHIQGTGGGNGSAWIQTSQVYTAQIPETTAGLAGSFFMGSLVIFLFRKRF